MHPKTDNHTRWNGFATLKLAGFYNPDDAL